MKKRCYNEIRKEIKIGDNVLVNSKEMLSIAKKNRYAIPQFNINNLEWTKYILETMNQLKRPVILGASEGAIHYMGGYKTVFTLVKALIEDLQIQIPVCLHLDHGSTVDSCIKAIDAGFTSVMIDASKYSLEDNVKLTKEVVDYAHKYNVTVEAEIGHIGGTEDNITSNITNARLEDCIYLVEKTGIDSLAPALGSVHGLYKKEPNLDFDTMKQIRDKVDIPLVLHGGTGIPEHQIKEAIRCGISKININTELQIAWHRAMKKFIEENPNIYDPRKIIKSGQTAIYNQIKEKVTMFMTQEADI